MQDVKSIPFADPANTYTERIAVFRTHEQSLQRQHIRLGYVRLALGIAFLFLLFPPRPWAWIPLVASVIAAQVHSGILKQLAATRRIIASYDHALARFEDRWAGSHPRTTRANVSQSLYAGDLDLFGPGSLFELLCNARTSLGEDALSAWLLKPANTATLLDRQASISELREKLSLREAFAAAPGPALATLDRDALARWGERTETSLKQGLRWLALALIVLTVGAAWLSYRIHEILPVTLMFIINIALTFLNRKAFPTLFAEAQTAARALHAAAAILAIIEGERFIAQPLQQLQAKLHGGSASAAQAIARLASLSDWIQARSNDFVRKLDPPLLYSLQLAFFVKKWKQQHGTKLGSWLEALGDFEALLSLAAYSYEHPQDTFPHFVAGPATFFATGLGHPLLSAATCVRNDVVLGDPTQILLISGSNMSGKSTLLRSVGVNAVLAFAGAPVRAYTLTISPLTLAASIQINDSLLAGRSRFYAEILRLRAITEVSRTHPPLLFLIDELLAGTNSSDRFVGAQGVMKVLASNGGIGMFSTHDLALTALSGSASQITRNMHFEDIIENGHLRFDYKLLDGVVERSNGLALMRLIGLDV